MQHTCLYHYCYNIEVSNEKSKTEYSEPFLLISEQAFWKVCKLWEYCFEHSFDRTGV